MLHIVEEAKQLFASLGGRILFCNTLRRTNFERHDPPRDGTLACMTIHAGLPLDLLGTSGDYLEEVHPRVHALQNRIEQCLADRGIRVTGDDSECVVSVMPYPDEQTARSQALPKLARASRGSRITSIHELARRSPYYTRLAQRYPGVRYGILTSNGTVVGPDGGLIAAAAAAAEAFGRSVRLAELGMGAGGTALALAGQDRLAGYWASDFSPEVAEWFGTTLEPLLAQSGVDARFQGGSCFEVALADLQADVLSVGVCYQAQPSLFARRGEEIRAILGNNGILIAQTGMLEDALIPSLLLGADHLRAWPWYDPKSSVRRYFQHVAELIVEEERIMVASNNSARLLGTIQALRENDSSRELRFA